MRFVSWKGIAESKGTSVSTEKRCRKTDPDYPTLVEISPGRVAFPEDEVEAYFAKLRERQALRNLDRTLP